MEEITRQKLLEIIRRDNKSIDEAIDAWVSYRCLLRPGFEFKILDDLYMMKLDNDETMYCLTGSYE